MAQQPDAVLKSYFETGDQPTQEQFYDLIDSKLNVSETLSGIASGPWLSVKGDGYNAQGTGLIDDTAPFLALEQDLENLGGGVFYIPTGVYWLRDNITFAANVMPFFDKGAILKLNAGVTVTFQGTFHAEKHQIFEGSGVAAFARVPAPFYPEWWGALANGSTDDYAALQAAKLALETTGAGDYNLSPGVYVCATSITFAATTRVIFATGAQLSMTSAHTATFNGGIVAPAQQIFVGAGPSVLGVAQKVKAQWWGAVGDNVTDSSVGLLKASAAIASATGELELSSGTYLISNDTNLSAGVYLNFARGAKLSIASGKTFTLNNGFDSSIQQIFSGNGLVVLTKMPAHFLPQYWGAKGDNATNDYVALNAARVALETLGGGDYELLPGTYVCSTSMTFAASVRLVFRDNASISLATGQTITIGGDLNAPLAQVFKGLGTYVFTSPTARTLPQWFGGKGDNSTDNLAAFTKANAAIVGASGTLQLIYGAYVLSDNFTFSANVNVQFDKGAKISVASGKTLTFAGAFTSSAQTIFTGSGSVVLTIVPEKTYPQWWGATGDGSTNDYVALNSARTALEAIGGGIYELLPGVYKTNSDITFAATVLVHFNWGASFSIASAHIVTFNGVFDASPQQQIFSGAGSVSLTIAPVKTYPQWWGAKGDNATNDYVALNAARVALEAAGGGEYVFNQGTYICNTGMTFASTIRVVFAQLAKLSVATGQTVTINGLIDAPLGQIFAGLGAIAFASLRPVSYPEWFGAVSNGSTADTSPFQKAFNALPATGGELLLTQHASNYVIDSEVLVSNKNNIIMRGVNGKPITKLKALSTWGIGVGSEAGMHFTDCNNVVVQNIVFDGNGAAISALTTSLYFLLAIDHLDNTFLDDTKPITNVRVTDCDFINYNASCLGVRSATGIWVQRNRFLTGFQENQAAACNPLSIVRSDDVWVDGNLFDGGSNSDSTHGTRTSTILIHPGGVTTKWVAAINHCNVVDYLTLKTFVAPSSASATTDATASYSSVTGLVGDTPAANDFFFMCKDTGDGGASAGFRSGDQMKVISQNTGAKTFVVRLMDGADGAGNAINWGGQTVYFSSINTTRFNKNIHVQNNEIRYGAGLFLLGCKQFTINGNTGEKNIDIVLDIEWCMNGTISDNAIQNPTGNTGIAALFFIRDVAITGNTVSPGAKNVADLLCYSGYEIAGDIIISNNVFRSTGMTVTPQVGQTWGNIIDGMQITNNTIHAAPNITNGQGSVSSGALGIGVYSGALRDDLCRDILIQGNRFKGVGQRAIQYFGIDGLQILGNTFSNIGYDAILDNNAFTESRRVVIDNNIVNNIGYRSFTTFGFYKAINAPVQLARIGSLNTFLNIDTTTPYQFMSREASADPHFTLPLSPMAARLTWDPGSVNDGAMTSTTVTLTGARKGDMCVAGFTTAVPAGMILSASVTADDTVTVTLFNKSGGTLDLASGTLRVRAFQS